MASRAAASRAAPVDEAGRSTEANSYISLGAFETMGGDQGRAATGLAYMQDALRLQEEAYAEEEDPRRRSRKALSLAQALLQVGQQHHQQQDPREALSLYQRAHDLVEEFLTLHAPAVDAAAAAEAKADGAQAPDDVPQVSAAAKKAVEYARFVLSEICSSLGVAHNDVGQQEEALVAHQKALTIRKDTVGKDHPSTAECLNNLGALYYARGSLQKAVEHYEQALERLVEASQGRQEGAYVALTLYNIGCCRGGLGNRREAEVALKRALSIAEQALGYDHAQVNLIQETIRQMKKPERRSGGSEPQPKEETAAGEASSEPGPGKSA